MAAAESIEARGYEIKGLIIDGKQALFKEFSHYKIQMCQFHMKQIVRRYLTLNPRLKAARALKGLMQTLTTSDNPPSRQHTADGRKNGMRRFAIAPA